MKSTILLTTALFLASAPSPDSKSISEISGGFLADTDSYDLLASEVASDSFRTTELSTGLEKSYVVSHPDSENDAFIDPDSHPGKK